jgi:hypothetical protein
MNKGDKVVVQFFTGKAWENGLPDRAVRAGERGTVVDPYLYPSDRKKGDVPVALDDGGLITLNREEGDEWTAES